MTKHTELATCNESFYHIHINFSRTGYLSNFATIQAVLVVLF